MLVDACSITVRFLDVWRAGNPAGPQSKSLFYSIIFRIICSENLIHLSSIIPSIRMNPSAFLHLAAAGRRKNGRLPCGFPLSPCLSPVFSSLAFLL